MKYLISYAWDNDITNERGVGRIIVPLSSRPTESDIKMVEAYLGCKKGGDSTVIGFYKLGEDET